MNGMQLADAAQRVYPGIPVMFISGMPLDGGVIAGAQSAGARFMLRKPFLPSALLKAVRPLFQKSAAED